MKKNCVIYHAPDLGLSTYIPYFEREGIFLKEINSSTIENLETRETLKIILIDDEYLNSVNDEISERLFYPNDSNTIILINEGHKRKKCNYLEDDRVFLYLNKPINKDELLKAVKSSFLYLRSKSEYESLRSEIYLRTTEFGALNKIGIPLSTERNFDRLLAVILSRSREITNCDAGSLYLLEDTKEGEKKLFFKLTQNDSLANLSFYEYKLAVDKTSIAGYVALTGEFVNLKDAYSLSKGLDYSFNRDFDRRFNYRTKSILAIPIIRYNKVIGVLQLINRKKSLNVKLTSGEIVDAEVIPFNEKSIEVINSVANHAALSIGDIIWSQTIQKISELSDLNKIGMALSTEQDYDKLLALILSKSREITNCEAGSLYLLEETKEGERRLVFKLVQNNSLTNLSFHEYSLPVSGKSIAGYVALTGEFINLEDAYNIPEMADYSFNKDFDKRFNYRTKSMLAIPMIGHNNKIIGVLELINRKKSLNVKLTSDEIVDAEVIPFEEKSIEIINSVTSQAAMSIENNIWTKTIQKIFELSDLNRIGIALSSEQDYDKLLALILSKSREITSCDAGSLYLLEETKEGEKKLVFKLTQNDSLANLPFHEYTLAVDKTSIAGYVALTGKVVNLADVYNIPEEADYSYNKEFDKKFNYRVKSMLIIPMKDHKGKTIGVLQLLNRKSSRNIKLVNEDVVKIEVITFDERSTEMVNSLASQAAVAIENNLLYQNIQKLFEGFVKASVHAIEQRDPTTFGHSERVATMTVRLAELVDKTAKGKFREVYFTKDQMKEIRYAGLLHDFGKVGVREHVLVKEKKLYPENLELIKNRFAFIKMSIESGYLKKKLDLTCNKTLENYREILGEVDNELNDTLTMLDSYLENILKANEPSILQEGICGEIARIAGKTYMDYNKNVLNYLTPQELNYLSIKKGTLSEKERQEIESHVTYSYEFLRKIPWTKELEQIPDMAYAHHEKLDGSGYPLKLKTEKIPIQAKMMAIADIYDALTAGDRPYKKAVSQERAIDIIGSEVKGALLDADIFDIFVKGKVFEIAKEVS